MRSCAENSRIRLVTSAATFLIFMAIVSSSESAIPRFAESQRECVVLIHGLGRTPLSMKRLEWRLAADGYRVINLSYPSRKLCVEQLAADYLHQAIAEKIPSDAGKVHFVTHSMGGIILRHYLSNHTINNLGRVVMLAPPNQGSELADYFKRSAMGQWILGPGGCQLGTASTDLPKRLGAVHFDTGVIAGNRSLNPWFSQILPGEDDGKVSVASAQNEGVNDFLIVRYSHTWMTWRSQTIERVANYLRLGRFNH